MQPTLLGLHKLILILLNIIENSFLIATSKTFQSDPAKQILGNVPAEPTNQILAHDQIHLGPRGQIIKLATAERENEGKPLNTRENTRRARKSRGWKSGYAEASISAAYLLDTAQIFTAEIPAGVPDILSNAVYSRASMQMAPQPHRNPKYASAGPFADRSSARCVRYLGGTKERGKHLLWRAHRCSSAGRRLLFVLYLNLLRGY